VIESANAPLCVEEMRAALSGSKIGREIHVLESAASTNDEIFERASLDTPTGLTIFAETQTAGRGQHGNRWESAPRKGLWFSVLLRPRITLADSTALTRWAAESMRETLAMNFALTAEIKPPNDVLVAGRKIAGVLVEMRAQEHVSHLAILGIGLNVNQTDEDFSVELQDRATSLARTLGRTIDRTPLAIALLRQLDATYRW
jgi:BirA family biotin operon repressor/biotin-[acetyl-CoA-carboxylase] ligase